MIKVRDTQGISPFQQQPLNARPTCLTSDDKLNNAVNALHPGGKHRPGGASHALTAAKAYGRDHEDDVQYQLPLSPTHHQPGEVAPKVSDSKKVASKLTDTPVRVPDTVAFLEKSQQHGLGVLPGHHVD